MKLIRIITLCAVATILANSATSLLAQDTGNTNDNNGTQRRQRGNFDPAQMQQRILERVQQQLGFTNDTEWDAVKPLVQKVVDAQRDARGNGMRALFGGRNRGGNNGDQGGNNNRGGSSIFGQSSPEQEALQKAIDDNAPASQVKDLLAKCKAAQQVKQAKLEAAQDALKAILSTKQEAQAYMMGLVR